MVAAVSSVLFRLLIRFDYEIVVIAGCLRFSQLRRVAEFRKENEKLVKGLLAEHEKQVFIDGNIANILKDKDHLGRRVMILNQGKLWNPDAVNIDQIFRVLYISEN